GEQQALVWRHDHGHLKRIGRADGRHVHLQQSLSARHHGARPIQHGVPVSQRRKRAQAIPEFAIVIPLFLLILFALIDFSRLLFTYISMTNGAREMARVVSITSPWVLAN